MLEMELKEKRESIDSLEKELKIASKEVKQEKVQGEEKRKVES